MTALQFFLVGALALTSASPIQPRVVASLDQAAFEEAQQRDDTATRAFTATAIKVCHYLVVGREKTPNADCY